MQLKNIDFFNFNKIIYTMIYRGYNIERDYTSSEVVFDFFWEREYMGTGTSIEHCQKQIDRLWIIEASI